MPEVGEEYKSGFVAVMGRPNVGKSTLVNSLMTQKIAAVSSKPQTTRRRQMGILTLPNAQIIFQDTPGIHKPLHKLGECMNREALDTLAECDLALFIVDASQAPNDEDGQVAAHLAASGLPSLLVLNKMDIVNAPSTPFRAAYQEFVPQAEAFPVSALNRSSLDGLLEMIIRRLPVSPPFYGEEQITDWYERDIAADLIREATLNLLYHEVPHSIAVRIDEYTERGERGAYIAATLFVERESQRPILIGKGGEMLKQIGSAARQEIEKMSGRKIYLELRVKVRPNWRNSKNTLKSFGYSLD
jgi:GTPase